MTEATTRHKKIVHCALHHPHEPHVWDNEEAWERQPRWQCPGERPSALTTTARPSDFPPPSVASPTRTVVMLPPDTQRPHDPVDHPSHYNAHPSGIECIEVTRHYGFNIGNVIKYLWRAGLKDGAEDLEDLRKARWYLDDEIKKREAAR